MDTLTLEGFVAVLTLHWRMLGFSSYAGSASPNAGLSLYEQAMKDAEDKKKAEKDGAKDSDVNLFQVAKMTILPLVRKPALWRSS